MANPISSLEMEVFEPKNCSSKYTLIWSNGVCTTFKDYMLLLGPLSESARIVAYNYRSHGGSKKRFSPSNAVGDLENIIGLQTGPVFLAGHCTGAAVSASVTSAVSGRILICPYLGHDQLATLPKIVYTIGKYFPLCSLDKMVSYLGLTKFIGVENKQPLQSIWSLGRFHPRANGDTALWMVASRDEVIGTMYSKKHYDHIRAHLRGLYPRGEDKSRLAKGLTHSLNRIPGHLIPFLSACPTKRRDKIAETISGYCERTLEKSGTYL